MKLSIATIFVLIASIALQNLLGQLLLSEPTPLVNLHVCAEDTFSLAASTTGGNFSPSDTIEILIDLPPGVLKGNSAYTGNSGITIIDATSNPEQPRFYLVGVTGINFIFHYSVIPSCAYFRENTSTALSNQVNVWYNGNSQPSLTTQPYNVSSSWLVFSSSASLRLSYNLARFLVPYERRFVYVNTSNTPFTGDFTFTDTTEFDQGIANVRFLSADITHPSGATYSLQNLTLNDSTVALTGRITNLSQGDSIVIREQVVVFDCPGSVDHSVTHFTIDYGCQNDAPLCRSTPSFQTSAVLDPNDRPQITLRIPDREYLCPSVPDQRVYWIINTGTGIADSAHFSMRKGTGNHLSYFDTATVEMFQIENGVELVIPYVVKAIYYTNNTLSPQHPHQFDIASTVPVFPGDTIGVRYLEEKVCLAPADYQFNVGYRMNFIEDRAYLGHPCFPTSYRNNDLSRSVWGEPHSIFALQQNFENYTSALGSEEEAWFCIDNRTPLQFHVDHPYFPNEVLGVPDSMDFQIQLVLDSGLGLIMDSLFLSSFQSGQDTLWYAYSIDYIRGDGVNPGTGDTATATFRFPSYFFTTNTGAYRLYGANLKKSQFFNSFLNRFSVKFKLQAYCEFAPAEGAARIRERTFLRYDRGCDQPCKIPLSEVVDQIFILCPGCILPGWNLSRFEAERINFDFEDADNNNFPDSYPLQQATNPRLKHKRIMLGDTMQVTVEGNTSDGQDLLFNNIGFDFVHGQLRIVGSLLNSMRFIGAEGSYTIGATSYNFTVPATEGQFSLNKWELDLGIQKLIGFGLPASAITRFWNSHQISIQPKFVVSQNLTNGSGSDPNFSVESLDAWIYMSGDSIHPGMVDANIVHDFLSDSLNGPDRATYLYWCTGFGGRITGIGTNFVDFAQSDNWSGIWGVTGSNYCYKKLRMAAWSDIGEGHSIANWQHDNSNQAALNAFAFEFRDFYVLDSLSFTVPTDYEIERIQFRYSTMMLDTVSNLTRYVCSPDWYSPYLYPMNDVSVTDSTYTIYPLNYYADLTNPPANCGRFDLWRGDETKRVQIELVLRLADCQTTRDTVVLSGGYPVSSYWSNFPGVGDTVITRNMTGLLDKPTATLETQAIPAIQNTSSPNISWNLNISPFTPGPGFYDQQFNGTAYNTFASFVSPSGNIEVTNVTRTNGPNPTAPDSADGRPLWRVGGLSHTQTANLVFDATYDCSTTLGVDSLYIITGWNCYDYPTDLSGVCFIDTTVVYIIPQASGLQTTLSVASEVEVCDTLPYDLELKATGLGDIGNISVRLLLPSGGELTYLSGSGISLLGANSQPIEPQIDSLGLIWHLDSVPFMAHGFNGAQTSAYLNFDILSGCGFDTEEVRVIVTAENFCGNPIGPILLARRPNTITGLPRTDSLRLNVNTQTFSSCGDTTQMQMTVTNVGPKSTGNYNRIWLVLPLGTSYISGSSTPVISGDTLTWNLSAGLGMGTSQSLSALIGSNAQLACGNYEVDFGFYYAEEYTCDTTLCLLNVAGESESFILEIEKPVVNLSAFNMEAVCFSAGGNLNINVNNISSITAENIPLQFFCLDTVGNIVQPGCLLASSNTATIPPNSSLTASVPISGNCTNCYSIMVIAGNSNTCICLPDTLIGAIDCDTVCRNVVIACPPDTTLRCDQSVSPGISGMATATGDCDIDSLFFVDQTSQGICPIRSIIQRTWYAIDEAGNRDSCVQTIQLEDLQGPSLNCPANITANNDPNVCGAAVAFAATAADNCGSVTISHSPPPNSFFPVGTTQVQVNATDDCGNGSACNFDIVIVDNEAPTVSCPATLSLSCTSEVPQPDPNLVSANDNCGISSILFDSDYDNGGSGCPGDPRLITREYIATDINGNSASCTQLIIVESSPILTVTSPNSTVFPLYPDSSCANVSVSASGGCPPYTYTWANGPTTASQNVCPLVTTVYTVTVEDSEGCLGIDSVLVCAIDLTCTGGTNNGQNGNGQGGNGNGQTHIFVCHIPPGNPANAMTKCLPLPAVAAHISQGHGGDHLGPCGSLIGRNCVFGSSAKVLDANGHTGEIHNLALLVYPNPTSSHVRARIPGLKTSFDIEVVDLMGQTVAKGRINPDRRKDWLEFDLSPFSVGIYYIVAKNHTDVLVKKVLKY